MHRPAFRIAFALLFAAALAPAPAGAIEFYDTDGEHPTFTYLGDPGNLPVRPSLSWQEAVAFAHTMPGVQLAMQTCASRGYVPNAAHDTAYVSIDPPATLVVLPYFKPGMTLPPDSYGWPLVVVMTRLNREGNPLTTITGGIMVVDARNQVAFSADSLPQYLASDPSFDVVSEGGAGGDPAERRLSVRTMEPANWFTNPKSKFNKFIRCFGNRSLHCFLAILNFEEMPGGVIITLTNPEVAATILFLCESVTAFSCMYDLSE